MLGLRRHSSQDTSELLPILSQQSRDDMPRSSKKWSNIYWLLIKVLCLFHGRKIVSTRKCHKCRLLRLQNKRNTAAGNFDIPLPNYIFPAAIGSPAGWLDDDGDDRMRPLLLDENVNEIPEDGRIENCNVCRSMWWNAEGNWLEYNEKDIGKFWVSAMTFCVLW